MTALSVLRLFVWSETYAGSSTGVVSGLSVKVLPCPTLIGRRRLAADPHEGDRDRLGQVLEPLGGA